jgi:hypothetical protein
VPLLLPTPQALLLAESLLLLLLLGTLSSASARHKADTSAAPYSRSGTPHILGLQALIKASMVPTRSGVGVTPVTSRVCGCMRGATTMLAAAAVETTERG